MMSAWLMPRSGLRHASIDGESTPVMNELSSEARNVTAARFPLLPCDPLVSVKQIGGRLLGLLW